MSPSRWHSGCHLDDFQADPYGQKAGQWLPGLGVGERLTTKEQEKIWEWRQHCSVSWWLQGLHNYLYLSKPIELSTKRGTFTVHKPYFNEAECNKEAGWGNCELHVGLHCVHLASPLSPSTRHSTEGVNRCLDWGFHYSGKSVQPSILYQYF